MLNCAIRLKMVNFELIFPANQSEVRGCSRFITANEGTRAIAMTRRGMPSPEFDLKGLNSDSGKLRVVIRAVPLKLGQLFETSHESGAEFLGSSLARLPPSSQRMQAAGSTAASLAS